MKTTVELSTAKLCSHGEVEFGTQKCEFWEISKQVLKNYLYVIQALRSTPYIFLRRSADSIDKDLTQNVNQFALYTTQMQQVQYLPTPY